MTEQNESDAPMGGFFESRIRNQAGNLVNGIFVAADFQRDCADKVELLQDRITSALLAAYRSALPEAVGEACVLGEPMMHGIRPYRWCATHNQLMLSCESLSLLSRAEAAERRVAQWERRTKAFQEGYRDKSFEVTALEIQIMDLKANGVDKVTARNNESFKTKLLGVCVERNELRARVAELEKAARGALKTLRYFRDHPTVEWIDVVTPEICDVWDALAALAPEKTE